MSTDAPDISEELVAPCGMDCAVCASRLALVHHIKEKGLRMPYCAGCRPRGKACAFLKGHCPQLKRGEVHFCFECAGFPCERLQRLDGRYRARYRTSLVANLEAIRDEGLSAFLERERERWTCPSCGGLVSCHNGVCFSCGLDELKRRRHLYRWEDG